MGVSRKIDELLSDLEKGPEEAKIKALQWIGYEMDPSDAQRVAGTIRELTSDASPAIRYHARLALDEIGRRTGAPPLPLPVDEDEILSLLSHEASEVRLKGVLCCYKTRSEVLFDRLTSLLRTEDDAWVRASLVKAVAGYRRPISLPLLLRFMRDPDGRVRSNTVEALSEYENPVVLSWIAEMVDDPEHRVQSAVLMALGRTSSGDIRPRLETMLASGRIWLQASAVYVIQELTPSWALEALDRFRERGIDDRRLRDRVNNLIGVLVRRMRGGRESSDSPDGIPAESVAGAAGDTPTDPSGLIETLDDETTEKPLQSADVRNLPGGAAK